MDRNEILGIEPSEPTQGTAITVHLRPDTEVDFLDVVPKSHAAISTFRVPVQKSDRQATGQFTLDLTGSYEIEAGSQKHLLTVLPQRNISFGMEFGLTAALVTVLFLGVVRWTIKNRTA